jgi:peroxiredoxin
MQQALSNWNGLLNRRFFQNLLPIPAQNDLVLGSIAPAIKTQDLNHDRSIELAQYRGQKIVLLYFTRIFSATQYCPLCYPHIQEINQRYREFTDRGGEILFITSTDADQTKIVIRDLGLQMPVLSDPSCGRFRRYGTGQALGAPLPSQFMVDLEGKIRFRHLFSFIHHNAEVDILLSELDAFRSSSISAS